MFNVTIPRHIQPKFPDNCIICGAEHPISYTRLIARDGLKWHRLWAGWFTMWIPCCRICGLRLQLWRILDLIQTLIIGGASFAFCFFYMLPRGYAGWVCGLTTLGLCIIGFIALFLWNRIFPPAFNISPHAHTVEYEFLDK
jgi:hypothetical protein